jgi:hypothetical protein
MINADPNFEMLCEIDKWRFVALVMLELQIKQPIPLDPEYLKRKGFDLKKRAMSLTVQMLHNLIEVRNETVTQIRVEESRVEKKREEKKEKYLDFVFLTSDEHKKLFTRYGEIPTGKLIDSLNRYLGQSGKSYKSHYFTLLNFAKRDGVPELSSPKENIQSEQQALEKKRQELRTEYGEIYRDKSVEQLEIMVKSNTLLTHRWLITEILEER